ncbi:MAG: hypothetical protein DI563_33110, partial [Variovorax paradoxus]
EAGEEVGVQNGGVAVLGNHGAGLLKRERQGLGPAVRDADGCLGGGRISAARVGRVRTTGLPPAAIPFRPRGGQRRTRAPVWRGGVIAPGGRGRPRGARPPRWPRPRRRPARPPRRRRRPASGPGSSNPGAAGRRARPASRRGAARGRRTDRGPGG